MSDDPEIEVTPIADCLIECDTCMVGLAGGIDGFCAAHDATAVRIYNKDGRIEVLGNSRIWTEIGRATAKVSAITKDHKP
jgi:hypothetical protein